MNTLIVATFRAMRSLFSPGMFGVFLLSLITALVALAGFVTLSSLFFVWLAEHLQGPFLHSYMGLIGSFGSLLVALILFPGILPVVVNFFDDRIARIIERNDYPAAPAAHMPAFWPELLHDLRFSLLTIALNILVLPLYFVPVLNLFLFYLLNGYLLGREFFVMAARRHMPVHEAESLRNQNGRIIFAAGIMLTVLATIPILNLFAPFWGIAVMVHLYHLFMKTPASALLPPAV